MGKLRKRNIKLDKFFDELLEPKYIKPEDFIVNNKYNKIPMGKCIYANNNRYYGYFDLDSTHWQFFYIDKDKCKWDMPYNVFFIGVPVPKKKVKEIGKFLYSINNVNKNNEPLK